MAIISKENGIIKGTGSPNIDVNIQDGDNPTPTQYIDVSTTPYTQYLFDDTLISGDKWVEIKPIPSYKVYRALLTQTGTSAPTAIVLENTLGGTPVWSRGTAGVYELTLTGAFNPINQTTVRFDDEFNYTETLTAHKVVYSRNVSNDNLITFNTFVGGSLYPANLGDGVFTNSYVEVTVFELI